MNNNITIGFNLKSKKLGTKGIIKIADKFFCCLLYTSVVQIKLEPCMQEIINRYRSDGSDYVFPFLTSQDEDTAYREYKRKFSYYNKTLKTLGKLAGVDKPLSSYVARHTLSLIHI